MGRKLIIISGLAVVMTAGTAIWIWKSQALAFAPTAIESVCYGTPGNGRLEHGVPLPFSDSNFESYSRTGVLAGRTHVHSSVRDVVAAAYTELKTTSPDKRFVYGETGWPAGGSFRPHKTHQNGLSVDFMVPVLRNGKSEPLPATAFNKFGYAIEFDEKGRFEDYVIDYEAMAEHLFALHRAAGAGGIKIRRVIFDLKLQQYLFKAKRGVWLKKHLAFSTRPAWIRHDEHYHVDFDLPCKPFR